MASGQDTGCACGPGITFVTLSIGITGPITTLPGWCSTRGTTATATATPTACACATAFHCFCQCQVNGGAHVALGKKPSSLFYPVQMQSHLINVSHAINGEVVSGIFKFTTQALTQLVRPGLCHLMQACSLKLSTHITSPIHTGRHTLILAL